MLNFAEAEERIYRNPIRRRAITRMGSGRPRQEFFEPEEWRAFIAAFDDEAGFMAQLERARADSPTRRRPGSDASHRQFARFREWRPFFRGLLYVCSRLQELADLRWRSIDLRRGIVTLHQQKTRKPKTLPIAAPWRAELEARDRGLPDAYVYRRANGAPLDNQGAQRAFRLALVLAGIQKHLTPHSIRHTALSWLATAGVSKAHRDEIAGHARRDVGDGYAHLTCPALAPALAILARIEAEGFNENERSSLS